MSRVLGDGLSREVYKLGEQVDIKKDKRQPETLAMPFYGLLPADHIELIKLRIYIRKRCLRDEVFREDIRAMCRLDPLFFVNVFGYVFEPRPNPRGIPLKLWPDQADVLAILTRWLGKRRLGIGKSRGISGSWTACFHVAHTLLFIPDAMVALISMDEESVDSDDTSSLLGKIVYAIDHLPRWMTHDKAGRPIFRRLKDKHLLSNQTINSSAQGFASGDNKVRGKRYTQIIRDETAFWRGEAQAAANTLLHVTHNLVDISTFCGSNNEFYHSMYTNKTSMLRIFWFWWENPARAAGMYTTEKGQVKIIDKTYKFQADYPFVLDGLRRSPFVDAVLREYGTNFRQGLEELFGVEEDTGRKLFRSDTQRLVQTTVRPPLREGHVEPTSTGDYTFREEKGGPVKIWGDGTGERAGPYAAGMDLATGVGAAYSAFEAIDLATGEQVVEFITNKMPIVEFTQYAFGIARWLCGGHGDGHCFLTFENNGELGTTCGAELTRLGYGNVERNKRKVQERKREPEYLGTRNRDGGFAIMMELERAIKDGEVTARSEGVCEEIELFDKETNTQGKTKPVYPYRADGHGDRTQGLAMAWALGRMYRSGGAKVDAMRETTASARIQANMEAMRAELEGSVNESSWSSAWRLN